jgi:SAM-dependent methyltransferase
MMHGNGQHCDELVSSLLVRATARTVIDIGCGTGRFAAYAAAKGQRVVGVDPRARPLSITHTEIHRLRYQDLALSEQFEAATLMFVLHALSEDERATILQKLFTKDVKRDATVIVLDYQLGNERCPGILRELAIIIDELFASVAEFDHRHILEFRKFAYSEIAAAELAAAAKQAAFLGQVLLVSYPCMKTRILHF